MTENTLKGMSNGGNPTFGEWLAYKIKYSDMEAVVPNCDIYLQGAAAVPVGEFGVYSIVGRWIAHCNYCHEGFGLVVYNANS